MIRIIGSHKVSNRVTLEALKLNSQVLNPKIDAMAKVLQLRINFDLLSPSSYLFISYDLFF
jgi:hypothetical protein